MSVDWDAELCLMFTSFYSPRICALECLLDNLVLAGQAGQCLNSMRVALECDATRRWCIYRLGGLMRYIRVVAASFDVCSIELLLHFLVVPDERRPNIPTRQSYLRGRVRALGCYFLVATT